MQTQTSEKHIYSMVHLRCIALIIIVTEIVSNENQPWVTGRITEETWMTKWKFCANPRIQICRFWLGILLSDNAPKAFGVKNENLQGYRSWIPGRHEWEARFATEADGARDGNKWQFNIEMSYLKRSSMNFRSGKYFSTKTKTYFTWTDAFQRLGKNDDSLISNP